jgi:hypothetical protein
LPAHHIDEVLENLDRIIKHSIENESRLGYFPALYRKVMLQVARGISQGQFEDGSRMDFSPTATWKRSNSSSKGKQYPSRGDLPSMRPQNGGPWSCWESMRTSTSI